MTPFTLDQWIIVLLVFLLGLFLGGWIFAGTKWKRRYREEVARHEAYRREEVTRREAMEREYKHGEAMDIAARARQDHVHPTAATTTTATPPAKPLS